MIVRRYRDEDFDQCNLLVVKCHDDPLPQKLGGVGVVIEEDDRIVAFVWALTSDDSEIACIEYFVVAEDKRGQATYAPLVMTRLMVELEQLGKTRIIGLVVEGAPYTESMMRIYKHVGMTTKKGYCVGGVPKHIVDGIKNYYGRKER